MILKKGCSRDSQAFQKGCLNQTEGEQDRAGQGRAKMGSCREHAVCRTSQWPGSEPCFWDYSKYLKGIQFLKRLAISFKATRIQRAWRRCISNPAYKVCQKRLLKEFRDL